MSDIAKRIERALRANSLFSEEEYTDETGADIDWIRNRYSELKRTKNTDGVSHDFSTSARIAREELIVKILEGGDVT